MLAELDKLDRRVSPPNDAHCAKHNYWHPRTAECRHCAMERFREAKPNTVVPIDSPDQGRLVTMLSNVPASVPVGLPSTAAERKERPIARGVLDYFPDALAEIAYVSFKANQQHNPGEEMHWAKGKSTDHADCLLRHLIQRGTRDDDGLLHTAKAAWRALALLQTEIEKLKEAAR